MGNCFPTRCKLRPRVISLLWTIFFFSFSLIYLIFFVILFNITITTVRTTDFSVVRDSHAAKFIERHSGHFSRAPSAVLVVSVISRARVVVVVIYIPTGRFVLWNHMNYPCQCQCNIMLFMSKGGGGGGRRGTRRIIIIIIIAVIPL